MSGSLGHWRKTLVPGLLAAAGLLGLFPASLLHAQPALLPPAPGAATLPACDTGYWIVSARDCDRRLQQGQCNCLRVFRYDAQGTGQVASVPQLLGSLSPGVPVCVMIHGSFVDWETVYNDSLRTNTWLRAAIPGRPLHMIFFTWTSDDTPMVWLPIDVAILGRRASRHGLYVAELISQIPNDHPITIIGHSHGARMAAATLHALSGGEVENYVFAGGPHTGHRIRTVFAAAAFDHNWFNPGERFDRAVQRPEVILNLMNKRDLALGFYPLHRPLTTTAAAARSGFTRGDRQEIGAASVKIVDYDITTRIGAGHIWPHYYADPALASVLGPFVAFDDAPAHRLTMSPRPLRPLGTRESLHEDKWPTEAVVERR